MNIQRRDLLKGAAAVAASTLAFPAIARSRTKVKVGYLHTPAVDGQIWTGLHIGAFAKQGLDLDMIQFDTGLGLFQAMVGGSVDVLSTGAVISNFPARGQGKVFLANDIEYATAQLWVGPDIHSIAQLRGKKIATAVGTTADVFLYTALRSAGLDPSKDVEVVNESMAESVTSFIGGAVDAVALWVPFDVPIRQKMPSAHMLLNASAFYPKTAIVDGWAARNDYFEHNKPVLGSIIRAWIEANDYLLSHTDAALAELQKKHYPQVPLDQLHSQFKDSKYFTAAQWRKLYADGTLTHWLQRVTDFFVHTGNISNPVPAAKYFDPSLYLSIVKA